MVVGPKVVAPLPHSSAATLGEISNKLNRQSSDLAYDLIAGSCSSRSGLSAMCYIRGLVPPPRPS